MNLKELLYAVLVGVVCGACSSDVKQPVDCVDPFIGTGFHGHTYPGATVPFGGVPTRVPETGMPVRGTTMTTAL